MTLFSQCYVSCKSQNKADALLSLPGKYPLVEIHYTNLLCVVLKSLLPAHLVIASPSADFGDTVTGLSFCLGLSVCGVSPTAGF